MMETIVNKKEERIDFISWIQFVGVLCVIAGHSINDIPVPQALVLIKSWIYTFHMPLFFMISAFLFSYKGGFEKKGYKSVFLNRLLRLLVPYVIWNLAFLAPKILLKDYINDSVELSGPYFLRITLYPRDNVLGHTWFLFALFEMFIMAVLFEQIRKKKVLIIPFTIILAIIYCFGVQERLLAVGDLMKNAFYFWIGLLIGSIDLETIKSYGKDKLLLFASIFLVVCLTVVWAFFPDMHINTMFLGLSVLILLGVIQIQTGISFRYMKFVSKNSFPIYILHWPIMMLIRFIVYFKLSWHPLLASATMLIGGILLPSLIVLVLRMIKIKWIQSVLGVVLGM